ncbi:hypothetical protein P3T76_005888 [Phytophthora citrophthora]|uniref:Uncharacterized protein n=1 Tax=Phytophthora citrophthora TaxID=4793 RepID=A0AAD9GP60_9STRA|nr:hypothetical protein P3T76_005888 [Phytophthora citrophthora]
MPSWMVFKLKIAQKTAYYAPTLERNLISYCQLINQVTEMNGYIAVTKGGRVVFYAGVKDNVLVARVEDLNSKTGE